MQIRVDTDDHIDSSEALTIRVEGVVEGSLERFRDRISLVEVRLSRLTGQSGDRDMCCRMEARAGNLKPIVVSHEAFTLTEAIHAASAKLEREVRHTLGHVTAESGTSPTVEEGEDPAEGLGHLGRP